MRRWQRPLVFRLDPGEWSRKLPLWLRRVVWNVYRSDGVMLEHLGTATRIRVEHGPPRHGRSWGWVPRLPGAEEPISRPKRSLKGAGAALAKHAGRRRE